MVMMQRSVQFLVSSGFWLLSVLVGPAMANTVVTANLNVARDCPAQWGRQQVFTIGRSVTDVDVYNDTSSPVMIYELQIDGTLYLHPTMARPGEKRSVDRDRVGARYIAVTPNGECLGPIVEVKTPGQLILRVLPWTNNTFGKLEERVMTQTGACQQPSPMQRAPHVVRAHQPPTTFKNETNRDLVLKVLRPDGSLLNRHLLYKGQKIDWGIHTGPPHRYLVEAPDGTCFGGLETNVNQAATRFVYRKTFAAVQTPPPQPSPTPTPTPRPTNPQPSWPPQPSNPTPWPTQPPPNSGGFNPPSGGLPAPAPGFCQLFPQAGQCMPPSPFCLQNPRNFMCAVNRQYTGFNTQPNPCASANPPANCNRTPPTPASPTAQTITLSQRGACPIFPNIWKPINRRVSGLRREVRFVNRTGGVIKVEQIGPRAREFSKSTLGQYGINDVTKGPYSFEQPQLRFRITDQWGQCIGGIINPPEVNLTTYIIQ